MFEYLDELLKILDIEDDYAWEVIEEALNYE